MTWRLPFGADLEQDGTARFRVWAPRAEKAQLTLRDRDSRKTVPMERNGDGFFSASARGWRPGSLYTFLLDGKKERSDPASRFQPEGVHGPSCLVDPSRFEWRDEKWKGLPAEDLIFYEAHIGTFTPEGTFESAIAKLPYLKKLGVTCLEIMPVAQFPGARNWGYDGVCLYAAQNTYGGPGGLKKLVDACHAEGLAVCLDVVYNHLGPEGNYLADFGPYFTDRYRTPWGPAVNYDGPGSDRVRDFVIQNALYWVHEYHVDALRLDAVHGIYDFGARHILEELNGAVQAGARGLGRSVAVIAESDMNDARLLRPPKQGGYGLRAQWSDDFHHALHVSLTRETGGYYRDFTGPADWAKALRDTFVYDGRHSSYRDRRHGNNARDLPGDRFVVCIQNHDQVGNRAFGDRLSTMTDFSGQKLAAAALLLSPFLPLLFMGQEYGEKNPFQYFVSHSDPDLVEEVRRGRKNEFLSFGWKDIPDPKSEETFERSRLDWTLPGTREHRKILALHRDLIALRKSLRYSGRMDKRSFRVHADPGNGWIAWESRPAGRTSAAAVAAVFSFSDGGHSIRLPFRTRSFTEILNTEAPKYGGSAGPVRTGREGVIPFTGRGAVIGKIA